MLSKISSLCAKNPWVGIWVTCWWYKVCSLACLHDRHAKTRWNHCFSGDRKPHDRWDFFPLPLWVPVDLVDYSLLSLWKNSQCYGDSGEQLVDAIVLAPPFAQVVLLDRGYKSRRKERRVPLWDPQEVTVVPVFGNCSWAVKCQHFGLSSLTGHYLGLFTFLAFTQVIMNFFLNKLIPDSQASGQQELEIFHS